MKRTVLSAMAFVFSVAASMADEHTFVLDGNNDLGGLQRQTSNKQDELTFVDSFSLEEEGVLLTVKKTDGNGPGLALINAGGTSAGLCVYSTFSASVTPEISLTVPNGKITSVKLTMSGSGLGTLDLPFNGKTIEPVNENSIFSWTWRGEGVACVSCSWTNSYYQRYIHSISVEYTPDLGGKQACELSFPSAEYEAVMGESFISPSLANPNNLSVAWTSSDENVATVDAKGKVSLAGLGVTTIIAATEGNENYAAGNAKYVLKVIPAASNIAQLLEYAPSVYDRVKVNFPMVVNYGNLSMAYVTDEDGNAACINDVSNTSETSASAGPTYKVGQVIPAGWIATNATINESVIWDGKPGKPTETVEVSYAKEESVTKEDADRVVVLMNVTFEKRTAEGTAKAYGSTPDGTVYEFQDTFEVSSVAPGTYDVTCVVRYSKRGDTEYFFLAPIAYGEASGTDGVGTIEADGDFEYYDLNGCRVAAPGKGVYVKIDSNGKSLKVRK